MSAIQCRRYLVITADDFGYSDERDAGILECYRHGAVSNVSVMVTGYSVERGVARAKAQQIPMGLHLNLSEGYPVVKGTNTTLTNENGLFLGKLGIRDTVGQNGINMNEVAMEIQAQIDRFTALTGHPPVNVDGHQHVHVVPGICQTFAKVLSRNNIRWTRLPFETGIEAHNWISATQRAFMEQLVVHAQAAKTTFSDHSLRTVGFAGLRTMGIDMTITRLRACIMDGLERPSSVRFTHPDDKHSQFSEIKATQDVVCELMVHPGNRTGSCGGCGNGPDGFSQSPDREHEMQMIRSQEMADFYHDMNIKRTSFESLDAMKFSDTYPLN